MTDVVFSQVSKRFGDTQALRDFDLTVHASVRSISFLGPLTRASCSVDDTDVLLDLPSVAAEGLAVDQRVRVVLDGPVTLADR